MNQCKKSRQEQSHALNKERHFLVTERTGDLIPFYLPQKMKSHVTIHSQGVLSYYVSAYKWYDTEKGKDTRVV